ncbi:xanthine dehydrogenase family protein molybdopterin-binding subunit [Lutibaculum baratangense]|uniref:Periplasmic aromatic aldehyde oxidoreductase, molybdenum binding subunit YagR n=1 Tax=Lutibaculum baratangense AMV1 TaxID=631454 RepID=V4QSU5_9HYPH|nr:xanthine dehydrogenase family protein molybdopterin-binding subunit [Lutibaculum baratangense]ESR22842.1 Periplasmic aromatic aldehyde oxidoreductase, molybdenum binding subunit YagR [Lutibaculum baratangense AMV1]
MSEYKMDQPVGASPLDRGVQGIIGEPLNRVEGRRKVAGDVPYAADHKVEGKLAVGVAICSTIGFGRVKGFDTSKAEAMPGVLAAIVDDPRIPRETAGFSDEKLVTGNDRVDSYGQSLGVVVAETFEQARAAANAVKVEYDPGEGRFDAGAGRGGARPLGDEGMVPDTTVGDIDAAMASAPHTLDRTYETPSHAHAAMEPHAAIAVWEGDSLTVYTSIQITSGAKKKLVNTLGLGSDKARIVSPYIGGGFGGKGGLGTECVLAAIAAKRIGRPVKLVITRQQLFHLVYRRSDTVQRMRLACDADGRLTAFGQDSIVSQNDGRPFYEPVPLGSLALYAGANRSFTTKAYTLNIPHCGSVRAPGEAVGILGVECAMDEMAEQLGMDPVEFRKLNEPEKDLTRNRPFSERQLVQCMEEGARRFGWERRNAKPLQEREGEWWIGRGMAAAIRVNMLTNAQARLRIEPGGKVVVETDMTDIGTGSYTILSQIAGEILGMPIESVEVRLGDSLFPAAFGSGGSMGAASSGSAVALAAEDAVAELAARMGTSVKDLTLKDGHAIAGNRRVPVGDLVAQKTIETTGTIKPGAMAKQYDQAAYGAHFVEVAVSGVTGETRIRKVTSVFAAGRILNAKTARSQAIGGIIWGIGEALTEEAVTDPRYGNFANNDLAEYHVPVHADIPHLDVTFLPELDDKTNPLKIKGIGELGIAGIGAAVNNAIYNATGVRVYEFPITLDKVLAGLPAEAA